MDAGQLPADFYGLNYLGRPAVVSVLGESPTGGVGTVGASATGGLGPSGGAKPASASPASAGPPATPSSNKDLANASKVLQGVQAADSAVDIISAATQSAPSALAVGPEGIPFLSDSAGNVAQHVVIDPVTGAAGPGAMVPASEIGSLSAESGAAGAGTGAATGAAAGASAGAGSLAGAAAGPLASLYLYLANQAAQALPPATRSKAEIAATTAQPYLSLAFPDFWGALFSGNLGSWFSGKPPAITFPSSTWDQIRSQVGSSVPQPLPVPKTLAPDQRQSIEEVNSMIDSLRNDYTGAMPSYLGGKQSGESWQNTMNTMTKDIQSRFGKIQELYPKAYEGILKNFQSSVPSNIPQGAPQGLIEGVSSPVQAVQEALAAGDYNKAAKLMAESDISSAVTNYQPQVKAAQSQGIDFLRQGKKKEEESR